MSIADDLQRYATTLLEGDFDAALARFSFPAVFYIDGYATVFPTREALRRGMVQYVGVLRAEGAASVRVRVVAKSATRGPAHSAWLECTYRDIEGRTVAVSDVRYYFTYVDRAVTISMMEFRRLPLDRQMRQIPVLRGLDRGCGRVLGDGQGEGRDGGGRQDGATLPGRRLQ